MLGARKTTYVTYPVVEVVKDDVPAVIPFPRAAVAPTPEGPPTAISPLLMRLHAVLVQRFLVFLSWIAGQPYWLCSGTCLAVLGSLVLTFPRVSFFTGKDPQILNFWPLVIAQSQHPLSPDLPFIYGQPREHWGKRAFRLTLPLLHRALKFDQKRMILLQWGLGFLTLYLAGRLTFSLFGDKAAALAVVFALSATYPGKVAFLELGGRGDGFALASFTIAACVPVRPVIFTAVLAACFTDERAVVASALVWLYWVVRDGGLRWSVKAWLGGRAGAVLLALLGTAVLRALLQARYGLHLPTGYGNGIGPKVALEILPCLPRFLPRALGGLWLVVALGFALLLRARRGMVALLFGVLVGGCVAAALAAYDLDRGLGFLLPAVFVALAVLARCGATPHDIRELATLAFGIALLMPVMPSIGVTGNGYMEGNCLPVELYRFFSFQAR